MLDIKKALRKHTYISPAGNKQQGYIFLCKGCKKEIFKTAYYAKKCNGYCASCSVKIPKKSRDIPNVKICRICQIEKPISAYTKRKSGLCRSECNSCINIYRKFKITSVEYNQLLAKQNNQCAICTSKFSNKDKIKLSVDHCHATGKIRGLLCSGCNLGLGLFKDDEFLLANAINYLKK